MAVQHVVVDGSNIATEGRTVPSLRQLDDAVKAFLAEHPVDKITVVVDATFGHRIDARERAEYEEATINGELVTPPAGAIGRGDAFVLQIADKADAAVLSNDSFQEFHGTYPWLFDEGRLIGGKPVPDVGWVFVLRAPVRGPVSRRATQEAKAARKVTAAAARKASKAQTTKAQAAKASKTKAQPAKAKQTTKAKKATKTKKTTKIKTAKKSESAGTPRRAPKRTTAASVAATSAASTVADEQAEAAARLPTINGKTTAPASGATGTSANGVSRSRRRRGPARLVATNDPMAFIEFVASYPLGSDVVGEVERFASHGAYVRVGDALAYVPLKAMGDPPPRSPRDALSLGESRSFVVQAFDPPRRGIDVALPGFAQPEAAASVAGAPDQVPAHPTAPEEAPTMAPVRKTAAKKRSTAKRAPSRKKAARKKTGAKKRSTAARKGTARKTAKKRSTAKKRPAKKKSTGRKKASAKKRPAKKKSTGRKKAASKKRATKKRASKKRSPAKKRTAKKR